MRRLANDIFEDDKASDPVSFVCRCSRNKKHMGRVAEKYGLLFADIKDHSYPVATDDKYAKCDASEHDALWMIFVVAYNAKKIGRYIDFDHAFVTNRIVDRALSIKEISVPKLTHALFLINPDVFVPIDKHTCIPLTANYRDKGDTDKILTSIKSGTYKYVDAARDLSNCFPKRKPYEISLFCRLASPQLLAGIMWRLSLDGS